MLQPTPGLSGTSGNPITIRALDDGQVTIDGRFDHQPVGLNGNSWFVLEGFNAKNGKEATGIRGAVIALADGSNNNVVRRVIAWDQSAGFNSALALNYRSTNNLWEDVAFFGMTGRKTIGCGGVQGGVNTFRRVWMRWEGGIYGGSRGITLFYNSFGCRIDNGLFTWTGESQPQSYTEVSSDGLRTNFAISNDSKGPLASDRMDTGQPQCTNAEVNGSLVYIRRGAHFLTNDSGTPTSGAAIVNVRNADCIKLRHVYSYIDPTWSNFGQYRGFALGKRRDNTTPQNVSATNITSVRHSSRPDSFSAGWSVSGHAAGATVGSVPSAWTATSTGANLCRRWVNGVVTNKPLWPWPMNQRIKDATASAGAYDGPCPTCVGGRSVRTATDVTADIQAMLGTIPAQCKQ